MVVHDNSMTSHATENINVSMVGQTIKIRNNSTKNLHKDRKLICGFLSSSLTYLYNTCRGFRGLGRIYGHT